MNSRRQLEAVKILGVDILRDQPFRDYHCSSWNARNGRSPDENVNTQRFLEILTRPPTVVITEKLALRRTTRWASTLRS